MTDQMLDDLVKAYLGEKIKRINIMNQNGANLAFLHGKSVGRNLGLSQEDLASITPFPAPTNITITSGADDSVKNTGSESPTRSRLLSWLAPLLIGIGGAGTGVVTMKYFDKPDVVQEATVPQESNDPNSSLGFTVK
jgi:hypothetical protein